MVCCDDDDDDDEGDEDEDDDEHHSLRTRPRCGNTPRICFHVTRKDPPLTFSATEAKREHPTEIVLSSPTWNIDSVNNPDDNHYAGRDREQVYQRLL